MDRDLILIQRKSKANIFFYLNLGTVKLEAAAIHMHVSAMAVCSICTVLAVTALELGACVG